MARLKRKGPVYVRITRFADSANELTLGVSGAVFLRVTKSKENIVRNNQVYQTFRAIEEMHGVAELAITPRLIAVVKEDNANWDKIIPHIEAVLGLLFGKRLRLSKRNQRRMSEETGDSLGRTNLDSVRRAMAGCALTHDEADAIYG